MNYLIDPTLKRLAINGFAFPLGWNPSDGQRPFEGYTIARLDPDLDLPDTHQFQIAVSHERLKALLAADAHLGRFEVAPHLAHVRASERPDAPWVERLADTLVKHMT